MFSNFYASGTRTDKAIPAILDGYPALPAQSVIKEPKKSQSLPNIVKMLIDQGYNSSFWYGGEINFANFNSFVIGSGFRQIITKNNFAPENYNSKWGVHDHVMFKALEDSMRGILRSHLSMLFLHCRAMNHLMYLWNLISRGTPIWLNIKIQYIMLTAALGSFLDRASQSEWWKNTLVILVADHCARVTSEMPIYSLEAFKIPMLWIGGAVSKGGYRIERHGSQTDIPSTLVGQLGLLAEFPLRERSVGEWKGLFCFLCFQ